MTAVFTAVAVENADETPVTNTAATFMHPIATTLTFNSHRSKISFSVFGIKNTYR